MNFYDMHGFLQCVYFREWIEVLFSSQQLTNVFQTPTKSMSFKEWFYLFWCKKNKHVTQYLRFSFKQWIIYYYYKFNIILRKIHFPKLYCYEMFTSEKEPLDITILGNFPLKKKERIKQ